MPAQEVTFSLVVQPTSNCITLLKYIDKNIIALNQICIKIRIEKLTEKQLDQNLRAKFKARGISMLPAMFVPRTQQPPIVGAKNIVAAIKDALTQKDNEHRPGNVAGNDYGVHDYMMDQMFDRDRNGNVACRQDDEDDDQDRMEAERQRRMAAYQRNRPQHHRDEFGGRDIDDEPVRGPTRRTRRENYDDYDRPGRGPREDNIDDDYDAPRPRRGGGKVGGGDERRRLQGMSPNEMDDMMVHAMLDNTPTEGF